MWRTELYAFAVVLILSNPSWADRGDERTAAPLAGETGTGEHVEGRGSADGRVAREQIALPQPLPAEMFQAGRVRDAYQAANELPDLFSQIRCYCGCAKSFHHRHLLDCFTDGHGAG